MQALNSKYAGRHESQRARAKRFAMLPVLDENEVGRPHRRRRFTNLVQGQLDVRVDPIYDFWSVAVNTAVRLETLFTIPQGNQYTGAGGSAIIKTIYHTNMVMQGVLDAPKKLLVKNISVVPRPDMAPNDVNALIGQFVVTFNTLGKNFWQGHALKLPGGAGTFVSGLNGAGQTGNSTFGSSNGWPSAQNMALITDDVPDIPGYAPPPPITGVLLETSQPFYVTVDPTQTQTTIYTTANSTTTLAGVPSVGVIAWVYLEGIKLVAVV